MPRWKALPDDLDPQVREFASQLRRLVDRSGLSIAAVADRTGYSKTSWERYLNGRLLAPKGAIVALAEVTGTPPVHLITMWELAERAWSRSEMRHDMTMQAIRISQARAALGELATPNPPKGKGDSGRAGGSGKAGNSGKASGSGKARGGVGAVTGVAGPAGVSPTMPPQQPAARGQDGVRYAAQAPAQPGAAGAATAPGASGASGVPGGAASPLSSPPAASSASASSSSSYEASATPPAAAASALASASTAYGGSAVGVVGATTGPAVGPDGKSPDGQRRKRKLTMFLAGVVGALVVIAVAVFLTGIGKDGKDDDAKPSTSPRTSTAKLPAGVKCSGDDCAGKDPETMGCGGELARTTSRVTVGTKTLVEVRYSKTCGAAWARITQAAPGDKVQITGSGGGAAGKQRGTVDADFDAYTPMVAVKSGTQAKACATLKTGQKSCTK
ncbi:XRE family transcriptional regulator [Streptomyces sp. NPDC059063]|uniref:XRE family transcriptional regulator n=1 Tax=unclassified Streptomyces TaxID=2593676 RepID=UPI0036BA5D0B